MKRMRSPIFTAGLTVIASAALLAGCAARRDIISQVGQEAANGIGKTINGWKVGSAFGDRDFYHGNFLLRAAAAKAGIYGNDAVEAVYPMARSEADGELLDGGKHKYTQTFPAGQLPPVNAFWSLTMYELPRSLLVANPINHYLINSPMLPSLVKDPDGGITLYLQNQSPGPGREANWLPAPAGPFMAVLRLYWPKPDALNGQWQAPKPVKV
jgi:hypothetical protein